MTDLVEIRRSARHREAEQLALVLAAMGIGCRLAGGQGGVGLYVDPVDADAARQQLEAYERENGREQNSGMAMRKALHGLPAAIASALVLLFFFGAERRGIGSIDWLEVGAAQAGLINDGAWWRTVTALTLHVDHGHLLGNLIGGIAIGTLLAQLLGQGLAWLAILLAGSLGNALNAAFQAPEHTAVGASTAIFGALGLVSGYTRQRRTLDSHGRLRRLAPLAAGVMLLVYLGFGGERTDVGAHVAGFGVGFMLGWALGRADDYFPQGPHAQRLYGWLALVLLALAWLLALGNSG